MLARLRREQQVIGRRVIAAPIAIVGLAVGVAELLGATDYRDEAATLLAVACEMCLPMATGMLVATCCSRDELGELQLAMPGAYRQTALYRLALLVGWPALLALGAGTLLAAQGLWPRPAGIVTLAALSQAAAAQLIWLAPLLWCAAVGLVLALVLHSRAASAAVLGGIWIAEIAFYRSMATTPALRPLFLFATTFTPAGDYWLANRLELVATALTLLLVTWRLLGQQEAVLRLSGGED
jgi:hypothetical protein